MVFKTELRRLAPRLGRTGALLSSKQAGDSKVESLLSSGGSDEPTRNHDGWLPKLCIRCCFCGATDNASTRQQIVTVHDGATRAIPYGSRCRDRLGAKRGTGICIPRRQDSCSRTARL